MYCYNCMNKLRNGSAFCNICGCSTEFKAAPHHLKPGTVLNKKYFVGKAIGEGGFGITYIGLDMTLDMKVAIKEFYPNGYANRNNTLTNKVTLNYTNEGGYFKSGKEQFLREAQSMAKFSREEGIVDVRDYFTENDTAYIIMEYIEGDTLADHLRKEGAINAREIFTLMLPVMRSLEKMHCEGIIHRDISPDNIMFSDSNHIKLMDFGSARYFTGAEKKTMSVMLKPGYAPYEQYSGQGNQGPWTDVYGLCATIYRCITGKTPVDSLSRCKTDTLQKPSQMGAGITQGLESVLMYGLAVFPEERCRSMKELISLTEKALDGKAVNSPPKDNYRTVAADDYATTYAERNYAERTYGDGRTYQPVNQPYASRPQVKQKNYTPIVVISVIATLLILVGLVFFLRMNSETDSKDKTSSAVSSDKSGSETIILPDVSGKKLSDASGELEDLGLNVETKEEESSETAAGYVIRQSVEPDRKMKPGDTVLLYVAKEPEPQANEYDGGDSSGYAQNYYGESTLYNTLCKEFVTLRSQPSMGASEITRIPKGSAVEFISNISGSSFIQVNFNGETGYALSAFFTPEDSANGRYVMYCGARQYANLRSVPGSYNEYNIDTIPTNDPVQCTGEYEYVDGQKYLQVRYQGQLGYVLAEVMNYDQKGSTYRGN